MADNMLFTGYIRDDIIVFDVTKDGNPLTIISKTYKHGRDSDNNDTRYGAFKAQRIFLDCDGMQMEFTMSRIVFDLDYDHGKRALENLIRDGYEFDDIGGKHG